jgi:hypothetical protein
MSEANAISVKSNPSPKPTKPPTKPPIKPSAKPSKTYPNPFTVAIDSADQLPYSFINMRTNADKGNKIIEVPTQRANLYVGDYSIIENPKIIIERKSLSDAFSSMRNEEMRANFEERLALMSEFTYSAVVVENDWTEAFTNPPPHTEFKPKSFHRTIIAWSQRYNVHWFMFPNRRFSEQSTFRMLERFWIDGLAVQAQSKDGTTGTAHQGEEG